MVKVNLSPCKPEPDTIRTEHSVCRKQYLHVFNVAATCFGCYSQPSSGSTSCNHWHVTVPYIAVSAFGGCIADIVLTSDDGQLNYLEITLHRYMLV